MTDDTIPDFVTTIILDAIEQSPLPQAQFDLKELCNSNPSVFGTPGLAQRRQIQKKVQKLKAKPISTYLRTLKKSGVQPGDFTREEATFSGVDNENHNDNDNDIDNKSLIILFENLTMPSSASFILSPSQGPYQDL